MKELSSSLTFFYKYGAVPLWLAAFGLGSWEVLTAGPQDPRWVKYLAAWLGVAIFLFFTTGHIKKVTLDGDQLVVSNYLHSESIPVSRVAAVDGSTWLSPKLVWLTLRSPCAFGRKITFIPVRRMAKGIGKHPLVAELSQDLGLQD